MSYSYLNNVVLDELLYESTNDTVTAAGATQATATALNTTYNVVTTVPLSTGVALPAPNPNFDIQYGDRCIIVNRGANALNACPPLGAKIDSLATNAPFVLPVDGRIVFNSSSITQWYSIASYNTLSFANEGGGAGVFDTVTGLSAYFRSLVGTANGLAVTQNATTITIDNTLTGSNVGAGTGTLFSAKSGASLEFNSLAGTANGLTVSAPSGGTVTIDNTLTGSNVGTGTGIFSAKSGASLQFNTLAVGTGLSIAGPTLNVITLANTGVLTVTGTTNQVTASPTSGAVVVSTPSQFVAPGTIQDTTGMLYSTSATVSAAGATQGTATGLTTSYNVVTTVAASTGVRLPTITATNVGYVIDIINKGANALNIYPATGATIDGAAANAAISLPVGASISLDASSTTQWYSINPPAIAGTGITATYGNGGTTIANSGVLTVTGTTNQVTASPASGAVVVSTPSQFVAPGTIQDTTGMLYSTSATVSAAGATQGTATGLTTSYNVVTTVAASTGVRLPTITATNVGYVIDIINKGANALNIYPATGAAIDGAAANAAISLPVGASISLDASSTAQWYTINPPVVAGSGVTVSYGNGGTTIAATGTVTYPFSTDQITVNSTTTSTVNYTVWDNARFGGYSTRKIVMWVVPSSGTRSVTVSILNNGGASLGSTTIAGGAATGLYSFTFTAPGADTRLDLTVVRSAGTATDPNLFGINMDLS